MSKYYIQSYKHDGTLHRTWDSAMIVDVNEDYIVIASTCNKVIALSLIGIFI